MVKFLVVLLLLPLFCLVSTSSPAGSRWPVFTKKRQRHSDGRMLRQVGTAAKMIDRRRMLAAHNRWRAMLGIAALKWSAPLEKKARAWAGTLKAENGCRMKHSGPGENLFWASPLKVTTRRGGRVLRVENRVQDISEDEAVAGWGNERQWYSYDDNGCRAPAGKSCGHYTQMVWRDSIEVGCAMDICPDSSQIWVCNYAPAGNVVGRRPY